ncbi:MAG: hypothetical protein BWY76_00451 [bacterium ADurb.Bin429]|nr:MAG: hypothetical protein BWY76_00451 [bacterium ADurb.Bin429]
MHEFFRKLQHIDRRWIYLVLLIGLVTTLYVGWPVKPEVIPYVQNLYDAVEAAPAAEKDQQLILVGCTFSASTMPENGNQLRALLRHLMLRGKRFAIIAIAEPQGAQFGADIAGTLAEEYGYEYGKDWISFGYKPGTLAFFTAFVNNIPGNVPKDGLRGEPITGYEIMDGIRTIRDISLVIEDTSTASILSWITFVQGKYRIKLGYTCTGVMVAEAIPFLDSGQLVGMLPGMKGAADYEKLVDELEAQALRGGEKKTPYDPSTMPLMKNSARRLMFTQGVAHIIIIAFIVLGNVGYFLSRRRRHPAKEASHD